MTTQRRIAALDGLRGVLALIVMCHHLAMWSGSYALAPAGKYCVWAFFVMSSMVLTRAWDGRFGPFLLRRFVRLWPTYAVCLLAGYAVMGASPRWSELLWLPWIDGSREAAMRVPDPPAWSLCIEATAMLFMPVIAWFGRETGRAALILPVWLALVAVDGHFFWAIFFLAGAALSRVSIRNSVLEAEPAQFLGKVSYSLYLSHWVVIRACVQTLGPIGVLVAAGLALPVAWVVRRFVESPSILLSRMVGRVQTVPAAPDGGARGHAVNLQAAGPI